MALANLSIYYMQKKNVKPVYDNNKSKISPPTWDDEFDFPNGSYTISDIQGYFECVTKKNEAIANNPLA